MKLKRKFFRNYFLLLITVLLFSTGCEKKEYVDIDPQLKIIVMEESQSRVDDAKVSLYDSEEDWKNRESELREKYTDGEGIALFKKLEEKEYYFFVSKDTLDNETGIATHKEPLEKNEKRVIKVVIK